MLLCRPAPPPPICFGFVMSIIRQEWYGEWLSGIFLDEAACVFDDASDGDGGMCTRYRGYHQRIRELMGESATVRTRNFLQRVVFSRYVFCGRKRRLTRWAAGIGSAIEVFSGLVMPSFLPLGQDRG